MKKTLIGAYTQAKTYPVGRGRQPTENLSLNTTQVSHAPFYTNTPPLPHTAPDLTNF